MMPMWRHHPIAKIEVYLDDKQGGAWPAPPILDPWPTLHPRANLAPPCPEDAAAAKVGDTVNDDNNDDDQMAGYESPYFYEDYSYRSSCLSYETHIEKHPNEVHTEKCRRYFAKKYAEPIYDY